MTLDKPRDEISCLVGIGPHQCPGLEPLYIVREFLRRLISLPWVLLHRASTDSDQFRRGISFHIKYRNRFFLHHFAQYFPQTLPFKWRFACEEFVEHGAQRMHVRAFVDLFQLSFCLLGRHIRRRSHCVAVCRFGRGNIFAEAHGA